MICNCVTKRNYYYTIQLTDKQKIAGDIQYHNASQKEKYILGVVVGGQF